MQEKKKKQSKIGQLHGSAVLFSESMSAVSSKQEDDSSINRKMRRGRASPSMQSENMVLQFSKDGVQINQKQRSKGQKVKMVDAAVFTEEGQLH